MSTSQVRRAKRCFVIGPIGEENTATRNNADTLLAYVVKPALEPAYEVTRADDISKPGMVDAQVIIAIKLADLIVSDLHGENPNAYYELGIAHCFRKKTIHLIAKGAKIPFDLQAYRTIFYDLANPQAHREGSAELKKHADALEEPKMTTSNPVTTALGMFELEQTGDSRDHMIAQMDAAIRQLKGEVADLGRQIQTQEMFRAFTLSPYGTGGIYGNAPTGNLLVPGVSNLNLPNLDLSNPLFEAAEISLDKRAKPKKK